MSPKVPTIKASFWNILRVFHTKKIKAISNKTSQLSHSVLHNLKTSKIPWHCQVNISDTTKIYTGSYLNIIITLGPQSNCLRLICLSLWLPIVYSVILSSLLHLETALAKNNSKVLLMNSHVLHWQWQNHMVHFNESILATQTRPFLLLLAMKVFLVSEDF